MYIQTASTDLLYKRNIIIYNFVLKTYILLKYNGKSQDKTQLYHIY